MEGEFRQRLQRIQPKMHGLAVGMTLGLSSMLWGQGCALSGLCPSCGACAVSLPVVLLPLLADGTILLTNKIWGLREERK